MAFQLSLSGSLPNNYWWNSVATNADGSVAIAVTDYNGVSPICAVSYDKGATWVSKSLPAAMRFAHAIACDGEKFCLITGDGVGAGLISSTTTDGETWEAPSAVTATADNGIYSIVWDGTVWLAPKWGFSGSGTARVYTSTDGLAWTERTFTGQRDLLVAAFDGDALYVLSDSGSPSKVYKSTDHGVTWAATAALPATPDSITTWGTGWFGGMMATPDGLLIVYTEWSRYYVTSIDQGATWVVQDFGSGNHSIFAGGWTGYQFIVAGWDQFLTSATGLPPWDVAASPRTDEDISTGFAAVLIDGSVIFGGNDVVSLGSNPDIYNGAYAVITEEELGNDVEQYLNELSELVTPELFSSLEVVSVGEANSWVYVGAEVGVTPPGYVAPDTDRPPDGVYPFAYPAPDTAQLPETISPIPVAVGRFHKDIWNLKAVFLTGGPLGVIAGYEHEAEVLTSFSMNSHLSDSGTAEIGLAVVDLNLVGARVQVQVRLNDEDYAPIFTGWLLPDSRIDVDYVGHTTTYTLSDGIAYLSQNRLAFSKTYGGANLDGRGGNAIDAANYEIGLKPEVLTAEGITYFTRAEQLANLTLSGVNPDIEEANTHIIQGVDSDVPIGTVVTLIVLTTEYTGEVIDLGGGALGFDIEVLTSELIYSGGTAKYTIAAFAPPPVLTRSEIIQDILVRAGYPYPAEFPNDGGYLGWEVAVTEEVPLDVIRLIAESVQWHFRVKADGTLVFESCYGGGRDISLSYSEIVSDSLGIGWGKIPVNFVQAKGVAKKYQGLDYVNKVVGSWDGVGSIAGITMPVTIIDFTFTYILGFYFEYFRYTETDRMPVKNFSLPGEVRLNVEKDDVLLGMSSSMYAGYPWYPGAPILNEDYAQYIAHSVYYPPTLEDSIAKNDEWVARKAAADAAETKIDITADVLTFVDRENQPSWELKDTGSIAAFGEYKQVIYENPFISEDAQCLAAAQQIINTSHRMGEMRVGCFLQSKLLADALGSALSVLDSDFVIKHNGVIESFEINFNSDGKVAINFTCSAEYKTE